MCVRQGVLSAHPVVKRIAVSRKRNSLKKSANSLMISPMCVLAFSPLRVLMFVLPPVFEDDEEDEVCEKSPSNFDSSCETFISRGMYVGFM